MVNVWLIFYVVGALREIRHYQKHIGYMIPRRAFGLLVREVAKSDKMGINEDLRTHLRFQAAAVWALQEAAEAYLVGVFEDANLCAIHCKRVTVKPPDLRLALRIRNDKVVPPNDSHAKVSYMLPK